MSPCISATITLLTPLISLYLSIFTDTYTSVSLLRLTVSRCIQTQHKVSIMNHFWTQTGIECTKMFPTYKGLKQDL